MIVIGVDAGATRTRVGVWRDDQLLGTAAGAGAAIRPGRVLYSASAIAMTAKSALARLRLTRADVLAVGAAGAGRQADADELRVALRAEQVADRIVVATDIDIALQALPPGPAIALLAGTGSIAIARRDDGTTIRRGGLGWQMGDEGSGYWIGREALGAVGRAEEGLGPTTALRSALFQATSASTFRDLVAWAASAAPREVATLAPAVIDVAAGGDEPARTIVDRAAVSLLALVDALLVELGDVKDPWIGLGGGLFADPHALRKSLEAALAERGGRMLPGPLDPLEGARRLALKET